MKLLWGRRRLYSSSVSAFSGSSASGVVRVHVITDEIPMSTFSSSNSLTPLIASSRASEPSIAFRQSSTVSSHSRKAASSASGVVSTTRFTQLGF